MRYAVQNDCMDEHNGGCPCLDVLHEVDTVEDGAMWPDRLKVDLNQVCTVITLALEDVERGG